MDLCGDPGLNPEEVVLEHEATERRRIQEMREKLQAKLEAQKAKAGGGGASTSRKDSNSSSRRKRRKQPYPKMDEMKANIENVLMTVPRKIVRGIPEGQKPEDYIKYRKCKYIQDIQSVRSLLLRILRPPVLNDLMKTLVNMSMFNNKHEHGLLTLQVKKKRISF